MYKLCLLVIMLFGCETQSRTWKRELISWQSGGYEMAPPFDACGPEHPYFGNACDGFEPL